MLGRRPLESEVGNWNWELGTGNGSLECGIARLRDPRWFRYCSSRSVIGMSFEVSLRSIDVSVVEVVEACSRRR